jgi:hypothetical protein
LRSKFHIQIATLQRSHIFIMTNRNANFIRLTFPSHITSGNHAFFVVTSVHFTLNIEILSIFKSWDEIRKLMKLIFPKTNLNSTQILSYRNNIKFIKIYSNFKGSWVNKPVIILYKQSKASTKRSSFSKKSTLTEIFLNFYSKLSNPSF